MKKTILTLSLALGTLVAAGAAAQPGHRGHWGQRMGERGMRTGGMAGGILAHLADGDGDGVVTTAELDSFLTELDANADGLISEDEFRAAVSSGAGRGFGGPPGGERPNFGRPLDRDQDGDLEVEDFRALFAELDENGDGELADEELPRFRHRMRGPGRGHMGGGGGGLLVHRADADENGEVTSGEWQALVGQIDADSNGEISADEWHAAAGGPPDREPPPEHFEMLIRVFDKNGNGILETSDLDALFAELDADGSGVIEQGELPARRWRHRDRH